jgi:hypothetical protein
MGRRDEFVPGDRQNIAIEVIERWTMSNTETAPVMVSRRIEASAGRLFAILADPKMHPVIDGSGMLGASVSEEVVVGLGDMFTMAMHNDELGDYEMTNHVVAYEAGRHIAWEPVLSKASRPEDEAGVGDRSHHVVWAFSFSPVGPETTDVTESFDCSASPDWLRKVLRNGERWRDSMRLTLDQLDRLATKP